MANQEHDKIFYEALRTGDTNMSLAGLDLRKSLKSCARLNDFDMSRTDFRDSDLGGAHLRNANLSGCNLARVNMSYSDLRNGNLTGANLTRANLRDATMVAANLSNANLTDACLVKSRLEGACLIGADLTRTDLRGAKGLTSEQLGVAKNAEQAVLDERMRATLGLSAGLSEARHGIPRPPSKRTKPFADFLFEVKPSFGDLFLMCGYDHPRFARTGEFGFENIASLGIEQFDDYFAICKDGDPVIWIYPLLNGQVMEHHPGPFDGIRVELARGRKTFWSKCVSRIAEKLTVPFEQVG